MRGFASFRFRHIRGHSLHYNTQDVWFLARFKEISKQLTGYPPRCKTQICGGARLHFIAKRLGRPSFFIKGSHLSNIRVKSEGVVSTAWWISVEWPSGFLEVFMQSTLKRVLVERDSFKKDEFRILNSWFELPKKRNKQTSVTKKKEKNIKYYLRAFKVNFFFFNGAIETDFPLSQHIAVHERQTRETNWMGDLLREITKQFSGKTRLLSLFF